MKKHIIYIVFALVFVLLFCGCSPLVEELALADKDMLLTYSIEAKNNESSQNSFIGICERTVQTTSNIDNGATDDLVADLSGALGAGAFRIWMHYPDVINVESNGSLTLKNDKVAVYKTFISKLQAQGIDKILAMSHYYVLPKDITGRVTGKEIPLIGTANYYRFLSMVEDTLFLLASTFPQIDFWEVGNEPDLVDAFVTKLPSDSIGENNHFTMNELALITADICFYANKGIKDANLKNKLVLPGLILSYESQPEAFLGQIYSHIKSGNLPSGSKYSKSTNEDLYFDIAAWHPYIAGSRKPYQRWLDGNLKMYEVMKENNDENKEVFFTEFGYTDYDEKNQIQSPEFIYENQYKLLEALELIQAKMPFVSTVFIFRLLNWEYNISPSVNQKEKYFGLFTSPQSLGGCIPKPSALQLFFYLNGENADPSQLFKYAV